MQWKHARSAVSSVGPQTTAPTIAPNDYEFLYNRRRIWAKSAIKVILYKQRTKLLLFRSKFLSEISVHFSSLRKKFRKKYYFWFPIECKNKFTILLFCFTNTLEQFWTVLNTWFQSISFKRIPKVLQIRVYCKSGFTSHVLRSTIESNSINAIYLRFSHRFVSLMTHLQCLPISETISVISDTVETLRTFSNTMRPLRSSVRKQR